MSETHVGRPGAASHWHDGDHFATQCGSPAMRAVVQRRWTVFADAIDRWLARRTVSGRLQVLDAGCGDGINLLGLARIFAERERPIRLVGLDANRLRLDRAHRLGVADALVNASLLKAPCSDGTFDVVLCNHVIEHIPTAERAVAELARLAAPGALVLIGVPNEGSALAQLRNQLLQRSILSATDHVNFFARPALIRLLQGAGLVVDRVQTSGFFLPHSRLHQLAMATVAGRASLEVAGRLLPSQAADLIAEARRP